MSGARQRPFDVARAARLDDPARFAYLPLDDVIALVDAPTGATVVDYGAGTGAFAIPLAERRPDVRVIALDVQPGMLELLRAKPGAAGLANLETVAEADRALDGRVACVLGVNVLHELEDEDLARIRRLLAPEGQFVTVDWNAAVERPAGPPAAHLYAPHEARERLQTHEFRVAGERMFPYQYALVARAAVH